MIYPMGIALYQFNKAFAKRVIFKPIEKMY